MWRTAAVRKWTREAAPVEVYGTAAHPASITLLLHKRTRVTLLRPRRTSLIYPYEIARQVFGVYFTGYTRPDCVLSPEEIRCAGGQGFGFGARILM